MAAVSPTDVYERLKELGCPALDGVCLSDAKDIEKLLCTPSPHRLDILEWICISIYPALQEQFSSLKESQSDTKIKGMAKLGYDLMLCRADDLDLIKGKVCAQKQLHFLQQLLAVMPPQHNFTIFDSLSDSSTFSSLEESFHDIAQKNEEFIKHIFTSNNLQAVLNPECHPWSSDIKSLLLSEDGLQKRALLLETSRKKAHLEMVKELEEMMAALQELRAECHFLQEDPGTSCDGATALQTLKLIVSDFNQLLVAFSQVYESELQKHCDRPSPELSSCGPLFEAVHESLLLCVQELQGVAHITEASVCIVKKVEQQHEEEKHWSGSGKVTLPSKVKELQQKYETIRSALKDCQ
uniref:HAUS augmin like complex subunit 7 n=1 Tax=Salvator merianae TaxID=96440 RepID=A0A8D0B4G7_SALMN